MSVYLAVRKPRKLVQTMMKIVQTLVAITNALLAGCIRPQQFGGGVGGEASGDGASGARDERPRVDEEAFRALAPRGASEVEVIRSKGMRR